MGFTASKVSLDLQYYNPNNFGLQLRKTDLDIFIKSFVWNASEFRFGKSNIDPTLLVAWFLKWININDDVMYKTFQTFIHGIIINETDDDHTIVFDFGTVEVNAIMELFELLSDLGVKKIEIESFYN